MPSVQRARLRGRWMWRAVATATSSTGRRIYRQAWRRTRAEAWAEVPRLQAEANERAAGLDKPRRMRFAEYVRWWAERELPSRNASTQHGYVTILEHLIREFGELWIDQIRPGHVTEYLRKKRSELGDQTRKNHLALLRVIAKAAADDGVCAKPFTGNVRSPKVRKKYTDDKPGVLSASEVGAMLRAIAQRWRTAVIVMVFTGLRWSELSALRWDDYNRTARTLRIRRGQTRGQVGGTKNEDSARVVPLAPWVADELEAHLRNLVAQQHPSLAAGWVFANRTGRVYRSWPMTKPIRRALKAAGVVTDVTTHGLRRTFTSLAAQVANREVVKAICGHVTDEMFEHYRHVGGDERAAAVAGVVRLVRGDDEE